METPPKKFWPIEGVKPQKKNIELLREVKKYMGEDGGVGVAVAPPFLSIPGGAGYSVYDYYDRYNEVKEWSLKREEEILKRLKRILSSSVRPDFILPRTSSKTFSVIL